MTKDWTTAGIFKALQSYDVPWKELNIDSDLDLLYYGNHSGNKIISPLLEKMEYDADGYLKSTSMGALASAIYSTNIDRWAKLAASVMAEYEPSTNSGYIENHTGSDTKTNTPTNRKTTRTETPTNWITETEASDDDNITSSSQSRYGFNSSEPAPVGESSTTVNAKTQTEQKGTYQTEDEISGTMEDETVYNSTISREGSDDYLDVLTRMRDFWLDARFYDIIFNDVDKVLTISTY